MHKNPISVVCGANKFIPLGNSQLAALAIAALACVSFAGRAEAQTSGNWTVNNSGNWSTGSNWSTDPAIPGGANSTVSFSTAPTPARTTTIDTTSRTVGILNFNYTSNQSWTVNRTGSAELIFDNGGSNAQLNKAASVAAIVNISAPVSLQSNLNIANSSASDLTLSGSISSGTSGLKTITTNNGNTIVRYDGVISDGLGSVAISNTGGFLYFSNNNSFSGGVTSGTNGRLYLGASSALGTGTLTMGTGRLFTTTNSTIALANSNYVFNGGSFEVASAVASGDLSLGNGGVSLTASSAITVTGAAVHLQIGGNITESGGARSLSKAGVGLLTLTGNNSYTAGTTVTAGTLNIGHNSAIGTGGLAFGSGGLNTFTVSANSGTDRILANNVTFNTTGNATIGVDGTRGKLTFGNLTATQIGSLVVNSNVTFGNLTGAANIAKSGNGTLEFTGTRSGAGSITVNAGTLLINGGSSGTPGAVNINSGGTLAGNGTVGGVVTIASGGTFGPGNSPGTMTFTSNLTLASGSISNFEFNGFTSGLYDLALGGSGNQTVSFGGTLNVTFTGIVSGGSVKIFDFENYTGDFTTLNFSGLSGGLTADFDELTGTLTVAVPEPSTVALLIGASLLVGVASFRRRARVSPAENCSSNLQ